MKELRFLALALCISLVSGCQAMDGLKQDISALDLPSLSLDNTPTAELTYEGTCPRVEAVEDLSSLSDFTDHERMSDANLISRAKIAKIDTSCSYDERAVTIDLKMVFTGLLGPNGRIRAGDKPYFSYPFFVAVASPGGEILAKEVFAASMTFPPGEDLQTYYENMRQIIPIESQDRGARYKILVGFQLNPDQLAFNRKYMKQQKLLEEAAANTPTMFEKTTQDAAQEAARATYNRGNPIDITGQ